MLYHIHIIYCIRILLYYAQFTDNINIGIYMYYTALAVSIK